MKNSVFFLLALLSTGLFCLYANYFIEKHGASLPGDLPPKEFAIVLGASVRGKELSEALKARMLVAVGLYRAGVVKKILLSGDGTGDHYDETAAMRLFALEQSVPPESLVIDDKGYSTLLSVIRSHEIYNANSAYIISQRFHLVRAVWAARSCGIDAQGVSAGQIKYPFYYYLREFFARTKDFTLVKLNIHRTIL